MQRQKKYIQGAEGWLKDTNCNLEMFLDQDRSLYRALGLPRSVSKVWKVKVMTFTSKRPLCPKNDLQGVGHVNNPLLRRRSRKRSIFAKVSRGGRRPSSDGGRLHIEKVIMGMWKYQIQRSCKCNLHHSFANDEFLSEFRLNLLNI